MTLLYYSHESFPTHDTGPWHPERPARLEAVRRGADRAGVDVIHRTAPPAQPEDLYGVHRPEYVAAIRDFCRKGGGNLDPDTVAVGESWRAALHAVGAGLAAVAALRAGDGDAAFLAVRPPGHHALPARAMGFCLFNNIAVVADHLAARGERVAIFDWDVHHGNGTQEIFYDRSDVLYVSLHEFPAYPGSGWIDEHGIGDAAWTTVNVPLPAGAGSDVYRAAVESLAVPVVEQFAPDWILVSAGYDAHRADPLADLRLEADDYALMAGLLAKVVPPGRLLLYLEGGYDLEAVEASVAATLAGAAGRLDPEPPAEGEQSSQSAWHMLDLAREAASARWEVV